jgi:ATP-dependent Lhr-like helicase
MQYRLDLKSNVAAGPSLGDDGEACFHPAVAEWLGARFGRPTEVQRRAWAITSQQRHALIAAPTGSGKTLAAFLSAINDLVVEGLQAPLEDRVYVLYVSPLKALSNDIQKNLQEPLSGIRDRLASMGLPDVGIRDAVRTGDTPVFERERMRKTPPHILVTTPESLFILLTSQSGRSMMRGVRTVIVDELHAVAGSKRGAHLMLSLERVDALAASRPVRIGLSATVKPLDSIARYLMGARGDDITIVDAGHVRDRDLAMEIPRSALTPVMSNEVWGETYDRLAELVAQHKTTLIFVNQRRAAERTARHLADRIGEQNVTSHHGSLSREHRLRAEQQLKSGQLQALVATSSLELGIDIGDIDLVCQLGSPRSINAFLQRVGRAGHAIGAIPKGRLFPLTQDDLLECTALLRAVGGGELDAIRLREKPLDVLAQHIVAEVGCSDWDVAELHALVCRADPFRDLTIEQFESVIRMLAEGYVTRRGRRGAYLHWDAVNRKLRARAGAKLTAVTNAGTIPDQFDYDVVLQPEGQRVGTLNEDFAFESLPGDIFQLGNMSYRIQKVETTRVLVEDANGLPPTIPFWFGEAPSRSVELSTAVSDLTQAAERVAADPSACASWLIDGLGVQPAAAQQLSEYWATSLVMLGALPSKRRVIVERFFDDVGDAHLVIHSVFGSRINRAWGLALRKRFCRTFNFELQASALEDSIVLSLGPTHSFPLDSVQHFLKAATAREVLIQALLDAPMFGTRWRWNATTALAIRRMNGGKRVPPQFQRSDSEDLLTLVFPDQVACAENLVGERSIPDHPLVQQTIDDCLHETMDVDGFVRVLAGIEAGEIDVHCCDLVTPSPLSQAILNARPYAFLDDGAAEERRTRALAMRPAPDLPTAERMSRLDAAIVEQVQQEAWPLVRNAEELHDALVVHGVLTEAELTRFDSAAVAGWLDALRDQRRIAKLHVGGDQALWFAAERAHEVRSLWPDRRSEPDIEAVLRQVVEPADALRELLRSRLELLGPTSVDELAQTLALPPDVVEVGLAALEAEGAAMRGRFASTHELWCDRRLLARMHRLARDQRRAQTRAVPPAAFMRFLLAWHRVTGSAAEVGHRGDQGLVAALEQLEGFATATSAWETDLLAVRVQDYAPVMLDRLCASGRITWLRPGADLDTGKRRGGPVKTTPILFCARDTIGVWQSEVSADVDTAMSSRAQRVLEVLKQAGASFYADLVHDCGLLGAELEEALGELVSLGLASCDSFAGLRALTMNSDKRDRLRRHFGRNDVAFEQAGRWTLTRPRRIDPVTSLASDPRVEHVARVLLRRYGVVFRTLAERETGLPPWRELHYVYRRLEARGEILGGRFVSGFSGEQFALPEAAAALKRFAELGEARGLVERVCVGACDPLNLVGIIVPGERVPKLPGNRIVYEDGIPVATRVAGETQHLRPGAPQQQWDIHNLMLRQQRASYLAPPRLSQ